MRALNDGNKLNGVPAKVPGWTWPRPLPTDDVIDGSVIVVLDVGSAPSSLAYSLDQLGFHSSKGW
jgi:hypothetical protein